MLGVSRSGYYEWRQRGLSDREQVNQRLVREIRYLHSAHKARYGSPRIHIALNRAGIEVGRGRVERLMKAHGIKAQRARRHKRVYAQRQMLKPTENVLNREFTAQKPNQKWVSDITFLPTREGFLYLAIVLDLHSRAIVGWAMSQRINGQLVLDAIEMAVQQRGKPKQVLVHSDQGSQYTAESYRNLLRKHDMICSMSRKGECHDNAVAESFFHTLKEELEPETVFPSRAQARQAVFKYIEMYYNRQRLHSSIGYHAPFEYETMNAVA